MTTEVSAVCSARVGLAVTIEPATEGDLQIHLAGELDGWSAPTLAHALLGVLPAAHPPGQRPARVLLDLHELSFLDSSGLVALEAGRTELLAAGWLVKAGPAQPQVLRLLRFADRAGWLHDGPLEPEETSNSLPGRA